MDSFWIYIFIAFSSLIYGTNSQRQCYTCEGLRCISQLGFTVTNCTAATDECVTIYNEYTPIKRACYGSLNTTEKSACDITTNVQCSKCNTDNCNYLGRTDFTCIQCTSVKNRTCLTSPASYTATRCLAPLYDSSTPSCYIRTDGETTQRGCLITQLELNTCATKTEECSSCSTPACNKNEFPLGRRKCYRGGQLDYCDDANDNCFAYNIYGEKRMCSSEVTTTVHEFCDQNPYRCMECLDNGCNTDVEFSINCRKCDSPSDTNCVGKPNQSTSGICLDGCATYLRNETGSLATTHRTCYENLPSTLKTQCKAGGSAICESCLDDDCNSKIFPNDRLLCYQCELAGCTPEVTPSVCALYSATDKCVSVIKNGVPAEFTCLSSFNRTRSCENTQTCVESECSESGCNNPTKYEKSTSCVQCDTHNTVECSTAPATVGSMPCTQSTDTCYTMLQGGNVIRGCLADLNTAQQTYCRANCNLCNSTAGCNNQIYPPNRLFCHQCDSSVNNTCSESIGTVPSMCLNYDTGNKCISLLSNNGTYIRTCSNDSNICKDTFVCSSCDTYGCNNAKIVKPETEPDGNGNDGNGNGSPLLIFNTIMIVALAALLFILNVN